ncbi:IS1634 family transposase, partial [Oceanivirga salmonicida]|uniref:IS1634 family transposase n=1 Tax=Oceanivirga salmonicida TaxID=1769291 RepID=UPI0008305367
MYFERYKSRGNSYYRLSENMKLEKDGKTKVVKRLIKSFGNSNKYEYSFEEIRENFKNGIALIPGLEPYIDLNGKILLNLNKNDRAVVKNIGYLILNQIFNELGLSQIFTLEKSRKNLKYDVLGLAKLLVFNRILKPSSKIKTFENKDIFLSNITSSKDFREIYDVLDLFHSKKDKIINSMNKNIESKIGRKYDFLYYDVTNYYFEIDKKNEDVIDEETGEVIECGLRKLGVSKERRKDPIIQMGMFLDNNSIPVSYELFSGNTLDKKTLAPILNGTSEFKNKKILFVADRGMINGGNELNVTRLGNDYLFAKGVRQCNKKIKKWVIDEFDYEIKNNGFKYKSKIVERNVKDTDSNKMIKIKEKMLAFWSKKYYEKELAEKKSFIETLNKYIENPSSIPAGKKKGLDKYIVTIQVDKKTGEILNTKEIKQINMKKLEEEQKYLGYYTLITSDLEMKEDEMLRIYRGLTQIENCFRITKSELETRPVYCSTKEHIKGHFLVCYIALTIMRIIQNKVSKMENKKDINVWSEGISS